MRCNSLVVLLSEKPRIMVRSMDTDAARAALQRAIKVVGSQQKLAAALVPPIRQASVARWVKSGRVPAERAIAVERAAQGRVTRYELRPDLYPLERIG